MKLPFKMTAEELLPYAQEWMRRSNAQRLPLMKHREFRVIIGFWRKGSKAAGVVEKGGRLDFHVFEPLLIKQLRARFKSHSLAKNKKPYRALNSVGHCFV